MFQDSTGDAAAPADIATVVVSSDDLGVLTFQVSFATGLPTGLDVVVYLDSDRNAGSGAPSQLGADYAVRISSLNVDASVLTFDLGVSRWSGTSFAQVRRSSVFGPFESNVLSFVLDSDDLGRTSGFNFIVTTENQSAGTVDRAPDQGPTAWAFDVRRQPVRVSVVRFSTKPKTPRAGRMFAATMMVTASSAVDLGEALDRRSCKAAVGPRTLAARNAPVTIATDIYDRVFAEATCSWPIPPRTRGKLLKGSVTLTFNGISATRRFSSRIGG